MKQRGKMEQTDVKDKTESVSASGKNPTGPADQSLSDEDLIREMRTCGGETGVDFLMEKYKPLVLRLSRTRFLTGGERDDLIQEGMIGLFKAIRDYEPGREASFATFAALCINRQMLNAIEASTREKMKPLNDSVLLTDPEFETELAAGSESPERIVLDQEAEHEMIQRIRGLLSPMEKCVLDYYLEGRNYREIAHILQKTPKSIDNALQRIRKKIGANLR